MTEWWRVRLTKPAELDFAAILQWTIQNFGIRQARAYRHILREALAATRHGPDVPGSVPRADILEGCRTLHVPRPGRHFLVYRAVSADTIEILRILHDAMDLSRHVRPDQD
ncbi:MAG: type II toxin-antitoxin system RelE/ParE family toxin [Chloroflexi bacterium]|nr:type II toxin-antitoxin system RelE/ParE family toxin [Chloroflexota bacterium]